MLALEFSITLGRTSDVDLFKPKKKITLARYHQGLPGERPVHQVLLPKAQSLQRSNSLLASPLPVNISGIAFGLACEKR